MLFLFVLMVMALGGLNCSAESRGVGIENISMTFMTMAGGNTQGLAEVEEAINEISRDAIGVEIELQVYDALESTTLAPVWLSQGRDADLMVLIYADMTSCVNAGYLLPLDTLMEQYGQGILALRAQNLNVTGGNVINGKLYGVNPLSPARGHGGGLWIPTRYLREAGLDYERDRIYTMEELDALLARLKALYPDSYPLGQITAGRTFSSFQLFYGNGVWLSVGDSSNSGVIAPGDDRLVNLYETQEYRQFLGWLRRWYEAGYICPDAAITTSSDIELLHGGIVLSIPGSSVPGLYTRDMVGEDVVCLRTSAVVQGADNSSSIIHWVIPANCDAPRAAMKFLNLMYTDARIVNIFAWGMEGRDYVITDREAGLIECTDEPQYVNTLGLYGNTALRYELAEDKLHEEQLEYNKSAVPVGMQYMDFDFDASALTAERNLVEQVLSRYLPVLESGSVDIDTVYPEFIADLKAAGIDKIIAEKQRQLDAFLESK